MRCWWNRYPVLSCTSKANQGQTTWAYCTHGHTLLWRQIAVIHGSDMVARRQGRMLRLAAGMGSAAVPWWRRRGPRASACRVAPASPTWRCSTPLTIPRPGCPPWLRHPACRCVRRHPPMRCGDADDALLWADWAENHRLFDWAENQNVSNRQRTRQSGTSRYLHATCNICHRLGIFNRGPAPNRSAAAGPRALARSLARTGRAQSTSAMTTCVPHSAPCRYAVCLMHAASMVLRQAPDLLFGESDQQGGRGCSMQRHLV